MKKGEQKLEQDHKAFNKNLNASVNKFDELWEKKLPATPELPAGTGPKGSDDNKKTDFTAAPKKAPAAPAAPKAPAPPGAPKAPAAPGKPVTKAQTGSQKSEDMMIWFK